MDRDSSGDVNMIVDDDEDDEVDTEPAEVGLNFPASFQRGVKRDYNVYRLTFQEDDDSREAASSSSPPRPAGAGGGGAAAGGLSDESL